MELDLAKPGILSVRTGSPAEEAFPDRSYCGNLVLLEMQAGKLPGIVSESEARGLETRRNGDLLGEGRTGVNPESDQ